jgi:hypothetical protein
VVYLLILLLFNKHRIKNKSVRALQPLKGGKKMEGGSKPLQVEGGVGEGMEGRK